MRNAPLFYRHSAPHSAPQHRLLWCAMRRDCVRVIAVPEAMPPERNVWRLPTHLLACLVSTSADSDAVIDECRGGLMGALRSLPSHIRRIRRSLANIRVCPHLGARDLGVGRLLVLKPLGV